jgi:hypothetical protein
VEARECFVVVHESLVEFNESAVDARLTQIELNERLAGVTESFTGDRKLLRVISQLRIYTR